MAAHEVAGRQLLDAPPIHSLGVELPIKPLQGRQLSEARRADATLQRTRKLGLGRSGQQAMQELKVAQ